MALEGGVGRVAISWHDLSSTIVALGLRWSKREKERAQAGQSAPSGLCSALGLML